MHAVLQDLKSEHQKLLSELGKLMSGDTSNDGNEQPEQEIPTKNEPKQAQRPHQTQPQPQQYPPQQIQSPIQQQQPQPSHTSQQPQPSHTAQQPPQPEVTQQQQPETVSETTQSATHSGDTFDYYRKQQLGQAISELPGELTMKLINEFSFELSANGTNSEIELDLDKLADPVLKRMEDWIRNNVSRQPAETTDA